ncbi:hypothetical protein [Arsukibacterium sp.]|uniref:hypothetical protein n=1 Tax=Arsukibacterium sp. TaxID=1977258 RepID=UPI001BD49D92|nr:hypothetical protein [Arsukibacterium sp.]
MKDSTKLAISKFLLADLFVGLPLYIALFAWLQKNALSFSNFNDLKLALELGVLLTTLSAIIGVFFLVPFWVLAKRFKFASYPSIVFFSVLPSFLLYLNESKQFYLYSLAISAAIGLSFFKMSKSINVSS